MIDRRSLISAAAVSFIGNWRETGYSLTQSKVGEKSSTQKAVLRSVPVAKNERLEAALQALYPKGIVDRSTDFQVASSVAGNSGAFLLAPGHYNLRANLAFTDAGVAGIGAQISGRIPGINDETLRNASSFWFSRQASEPKNQATVSSHMVGAPSGRHKINFEKDAFSSSQTVYDNSIYVHDGDMITSGKVYSSRDFAGFGSHTTVPAGYNLTRTRTWGAAHYTLIGALGSEQLADGYAVGVEARIDNYGSAAQGFETSTTKSALQLIGGGNRRITCFSFASTSDGAGGSGAFYGHAVDSAAVSLFAFAVMQINGITPQNALWGVTPTGAIAMKAQEQPPVNTSLVQIYFDGTKLKMVLPDGTVKTFMTE